MASVGTLVNEAQKRKERLKALRNKNATDDDTDMPNKKAAVDDGEKLPKPVFRSYKPQDESLKESVLPRSKPADVTEQVKGQLEQSKPEPLVEAVDLINLAPRKPDWDLKRDVAKKLDKLERRTQRAIAELIRDRLDLGKEDLLAAVDANLQANQDEEDD